MENEDLYVYKKSDFYEDYISSQKEYYERENADAYFAEKLAEKDKEIAELKDKCQMHDFFWEGCGFAKRGFKNSIAVSEAFDELENENKELKQKLEDAKDTAYAESVDAGMRERRLRRALWLARAEWARLKVLEYWPDYCHNAHCRIAEQKWDKVQIKCRAMAEKFK